MQPQNIPPPPGYSASDIVPVTAPSQDQPQSQPQASAPAAPSIPPPPPGYTADDVVPASSATSSDNSFSGGQQLQNTGQPSAPFTAGQMVTVNGHHGFVTGTNPDGKVLVDWGISPLRHTFDNVTAVSPSDISTDPGAFRSAIAGIGQSFLESGKGVKKFLDKHPTLETGLGISPSEDTGTFNRMQQVTQAATAPNPTSAGVGSLIGGLTQFVAADDAAGNVTGSVIPTLEHYAEGTKIAKLLEAHPTLARYVRSAVNGGLAQGSVSGVQSGGDVAETAKGAAEGAALGTAGEVIPDAVQAIKSAPSKIAQVARKIYPEAAPEQPIYEALHQQVRDAVASAAKDAGVAVKDSDSIQDVAANAAKAFKAEASKVYGQIDEALTAMADDGSDMKGRYQAVDENITKLKKKVSDLIGEPEKQAQAQEVLGAENAKKQVIMQKLKDAGLEDLPEKASALHRQGSALEDFGQKVQQNTSGLPGHPDVPERLNPKTFANSLRNLKNSTDFGGNRLRQALGDSADTLITQTNDAKAALQKAAEAAAQRALVKGYAIKSAIGGGVSTLLGGLGYEAVHKATE